MVNFLIKNVLHVLGIWKNLFLAKQFDQVGCEIIIKIIFFNINKNGHKISKCILKNLYMLGVTYKQEDEIKTLNVTHFNITNIWHMKLGHINQQRLKKI